MRRGGGRRAALFVLLAVSATTTACGGSSAAEHATPAKRITTFDQNLLSSEILGLAVRQEDISKTTGDEKSYVDRLSLYSLRRGDLLQATFQVSRFNSRADYDSAEFRGRLLNRLGGARPRTLRVGDKTVHVSSSNRQQLAIWFKDRHMFVLAWREEYEQPRSLLREMLKLSP